jgi:hypothetical protein
VSVGALAALLLLSAAVPATARSATILIAGDIAEGAALSQEAATADLVAARGGIVMTAGDNAYPDGSPADFQTRYHPTCGRFKARTRPTPGNHDYETPRGEGYFDYFGGRAGPRLPNGRGRGYYAFHAGSWLVLALDSEACLRSVGCGSGSPQHTWLKRVLRRESARCTMAVWHTPLFSSGLHGDQPLVRPLVRLLYDHGAEIIINGHDHDYERMAPARPDGAIDSRFGLRQFIVGTGGAVLREEGAAAVPHRRVFQATAHGVLRLRLNDRGYSWSFLPIEGASFADSGSGRCHGKPG